MNLVFLCPSPTSPLAVIYNQSLSIANTSSIVGEVLHLARVEAEGTTPSRPSRRSLRSVFRFVLAAAALSTLVGCGNTYRPVVAAFNPVGPASQPTKYAVAISSTGPNTPGLATFVDFSGDTVMITASVGVNPYYLVLDAFGSEGYSLNSDKTFTSFPISTGLLSSQIIQNTLLDNNNVAPPSLTRVGAFAYLPQPGRTSIAEYTGSPLALQQEFSVNPAYSPVFVVSAATAPRVYSIDQAVNGGNGQVTPIETSSNTPDQPFSVGVDPVYGVMTSDARRAFILNNGSNDITVINSQTNQIDTPTGTIHDPNAVGPIWADFAPTLNELVVANAGDGVNPGSVSIISIPLCTATSRPTNPTCDPSNPVDAVGFGTVIANIPVGVNPRMVGVLQDGTKAYVINGGNPSLPCAGSGVAASTTNCSVSVINLTSNTVVATIPLPLNPDPTSSNLNGHPNYIAVTTGTPTGKVYVTSAESNFMTVIRTDIDTVLTQIPLQGTGVAVRVTAP